MKKKVSFLLCFALFFTVVFCSVSCTHEFTPNILENTVTIGLEESFTIIHTTDTHLTFTSDADDSGMRRYGKKRTKRFGYVQEDKLSYVSALSKEKDMLICHTGDIMDFITDLNLQKTKDFLENNNCIYTPGNHDVDDGNAEAIARLAQVVPYSYDFYSLEYHGVNFVAINNALHKMTNEQLNKLKSVVHDGKPIVLLVHVPLYTKDLYDVAMQDSDAAYLMAVPEELMTGYSEYRYASQKADQSTIDAYNYILSCSSIKCILAGHVHFEYETTLGEYNIPQLIGGLDTVRLVTFA